MLLNRTFKLLISKGKQPILMDAPLGPACTVSFLLTYNTCTHPKRSHEEEPPSPPPRHSPPVLLQNLHPGHSTTVDIEFLGDFPNFGWKKTKKFIINVRNNCFFKSLLMIYQIILTCTWFWLAHSWLAPCFLFLPKILAHTQNAHMKKNRHQHCS